MTDDQSISAKLGDYSSFKAEMLDSIPRVVVDTGGDAVTHPLIRLNLGVPTDPTVAMVDAFAAVADVISFYQDRVLNEGYLPTAIDYSSLALLGRSISENPEAHIGATAEVAVFAQPGPLVTVPMGAELQANPPKPNASTSGTNSSTKSGTSASSAPTFATAAELVANPAHNQLTPLQTKPVYLDSSTESLLIQGTGLGLAVGDFILLVRRAHPTQWVRLTVFSVTENHPLVTTTIGIGSSLQSQWTANGCTEPLPHNILEGLELYALDLTCRLFGYNARPWSSQSAAVQRANTPTGMSPAEYTEWPGFEIDLNDLDLQAVYSKVLPGSQFLLETPEDNTLGVIAAVSNQNVSEFGLTGQATQVTLAPDPAVLPTGIALIPSRTGVTASMLGDGRVLLTGGIGQQGALDSVEIYDPATGLLSQAPALPFALGLHTATTIEGSIYLAGGVTSEDDGAWRFANNILQLDLSTMTFQVISGVVLATPRVGHAAIALPDDALMLSGGLTGDASVRYPSLDDLLAASTATRSVVAFSPLQNNWAWEADMQRARTGHSATLCPVVKTAEDGGSASAPPVGQIVVFLGGHDGGAMPPGEAAGNQTGKIWNDAEVTDPTAWRPLPGLYPIETGSDGEKGSARYNHVATELTGNNGFLVSGGESPSGPVSDDWLVGAFADYDPSGADSFTGVPVFVPAPSLHTARSNHAAALLQDGKIVIAGGIADRTVLDSVEIFNVSAGTSIPFDGGSVLSPSIAGSSLPQPQAYPAFLAMPGGKMLVAGGLGSLPDDYLNAVVAYNPDVGAFKSIPGPILTVPDTLAPVGSIGLADGTILILGSTSPMPFPLSPPEMTGFAWTFDPATNLSTITGSPVTARIGATLSLLPNGTVLVAGGMGMTATGYAVLDTAEIYDPKSRSFRQIQSKMTVPRSGHTATVLVDGTVLLAGGYFYPPITYDPPGVLATWVPALTSAETFDVAQQSFTPAASTLPKGVAFHSATLLASGDVLIAGGVTDFYVELDIASVTVFPSTQAAVFNVSARGFALISPLGIARAMHSATLLTSGKVLIAGGVVKPDMEATATTELFDPAEYAFAPSVSLAVPRRSQGAIMIPAGILLIGGVGTQSYEIITVDGNNEQAAYPLPFPLPSPDYPLFVSLAETVTPVPVAGHGIYVFGGQIQGGGTNTCEAVLYVEAPPASDSDARRQALVYTQSSELFLAQPINNAPLTGSKLVLTGLISDIDVGHNLLIVGEPPLAETVGTVTGIDGSPQLQPGTVIMVLQSITSTTVSWSAEVPDIGLLSIQTDPRGEPPSDLSFLSGNGTTVGNVTMEQLALFNRPILGEAITVRSVKQCADTNSTILHLDRPMRYLFDRTTTTVYGNVVEATQGSRVDEVLGSGDGQKAFQNFILNQAPLTWLEQPDGSIAPQLQVTVNGVTWTRVLALGDCDADARAYQLTQDAQGRGLIQFGNGVHGLRPPTGQNNISATYRVGGGPGGNVPAGSLTRPPVNVPGIKGVLNPVNATGGVGPAARSTLRGKIPIGVADLGRILTHSDMLTFVLNRPEIGAATLSTAHDPSSQNSLSLITLAGLDNAEPDTASPAFSSLEAAFEKALASGEALKHQLLPFDPLPFKVTGKFTLKGNADTQLVESSITATLQTAYDLSVMTFGQAVLAEEIVELIRKNVPAVQTVEVTDIWAPTEGSPVGQKAIYPKKARFSTLTWIGAQILGLSTDADAVTFELKSS